MFYKQCDRVSTVFLFICALKLGGTEFTHDRKRLGDPDFVVAEHGCLQKYKVRENSIIRTQDSKSLGAIFLNESDVGNREDCLNMCCNTPRCNVAVFEENSPFSCYLFDCGGVGDFRCRFTTHSYYTSALLNREQLELGIWSSQYKHETDLSNLRTNLGGTPEIKTTLKPSPPPTTNLISPEAPVTSTVSPVIYNNQKTLHPQLVEPIPEKSCTRFQFECHNKECIAIYNVCDGISQCQDGSDESQELNCPSNAANLPSTEKQPSGRLPQSDNGNGSQQPGGDSGGLFNHRSTILDYNHQNQANYPINDRVTMNQYDTHDTERKFFDYNQRAPWPNSFPGRQREGPHGDMNQFYPTRYSDYGFNDNGAPKDPKTKPNEVLPSQVQEQPNSSFPVYVPLPRKPSYSQQEVPIWNRQNNNAPMQSPQQPQIQPYNANMRTNVAQKETSQQVFYPKEVASPSIPNKATVSQQVINETRPIHPEPISYSQAELANQNVNLKQDLNASGRSSTGNALPAKLESEQSAENPTSLNPVNAVESSTSIPKAKSQYLSLSQLDINLHEFENKDSEQNSQASGAVLALSLGICITFLMVVLVGCRMKGTKRRVRRYRGDRSKLEHDADYLVNGMYL